MYEIINNVHLKVKEYKGQRVVTFKDIDMVHGRPEGTAHRNFKKNRNHFIEGEDFFIVKPADIQKDEIRPFGFEVPNRGIILLTENGYLMIVKSLTDKLAWKVQRELVNTYFRARQMETYYNDEVLKKLDRLENEISHIRNDIKLLDRKIDDTERIFRKSLIENNHVIMPAFISISNSILKVSDDISRTVRNFITYYMEKF